VQLTTLPVFEASSASFFAPKPVTVASLDTQLSTRAQARPALAFVDAGGTLTDVVDEAIPEQAPEQTYWDRISPWASPPEDAAPPHWTDPAGASESSERVRKWATIPANSSHSAVDAFLGIVGSLEVLETPLPASGAGDDASELDSAAHPLEIAFVLAGGWWGLGFAGSPSGRTSSFPDGFPRKRGELDRPM
jgi:hypothetical protein